MNESGEYFLLYFQKQTGNLFMLQTSSINTTNTTAPSPFKYDVFATIPCAIKDTALTFSSYLPAP